MKNFYSKLMMGFLLLSTSTINAQTTYCTTTWSGWAVNEPTEPITSVQFGTGTGSINNTSSATVATTTPRYEDFSTISMNVQRGQTYDLKVKGNTDGNNTNYITVYFDWNGDGVFSNATPANAAAQQQLTNQPEKHQHTTAIINSTGADNIEMIHSVIIPTDAVLGSIRMRIVKNYNAPSPAPCANPFIFGQVEDYTLNITNGSCPAVSSFSENFDAPTLTCCNMGVVPQCWNSISTATGANQIISTTTPASGTNNIYQFGYGTNLQSIVVMPEVTNINAGTHQFRFKLRANSGPGNLDFGYITDITNAATFVIIQTINVTNSSYNDPIAERTLTVPTTVPSTARLAIRNPGTSWAGFYWDDANWEPIPSTIQSVNITTQNNVAATITAANGTLQLQAAITPSTANQAVTWSVQSGNTSATVDNTGLVTGLTNGTAIIRATSVADTTKFGELTVTVNIPTANPCTTVQTFLETFDTFTTFPENCWTANYPNQPFITLKSDKTLQMYSNNQPDDVILVSPEVSTIDGQHQLVFDIISTVGAGTTIQIGTMTDNTDFSTFTAVGSPFTPSVGSHSTQAIPANAGHKYVAIRFVHGGGHGKVLIVDNVEWKQVTASNDKFDADKVKIYPNPTTGMLFIDTDINVKSIEIYNTSGQRILKTTQKTINLENAANGLYIVNVYAADGTHASYKVIKK